ncbi:MAG: GPW/gp25 family protein [Chitinophagales bacterium]
MEYNNNNTPNYQYSFIGTGWSFPPAFSEIKEGAEMVSGKEDIDQSLYILLSTSKGENLLNPDYGCNLKDLVFESYTTTLQATIRNLVTQSILFFEPRITLEKVVVAENPNVLGRIDILVEYIIPNINSRTNMVYPFYLKR